MIRREIGHMSIALAMVSALLLLAISGALAAPQAQQAAVVMTDNSFNPQSLTVTVGTTVTWTNNGNNPHTATSDTGAFDSGSRATYEEGAKSTERPPPTRYARFIAQSYRFAPPSCFKSALHFIVNVLRA